MPDNSYYPTDTAGAEPQQPDTSKPDESKTDDSNSEDSSTALLPKSFFGSNEPEIDSECKVKVVHVYEDEVEVEYVKEDSSKSPDSANAMIDDMASANQAEE